VKIYDPESLGPVVKEIADKFILEESAVAEHAEGTDLDDPQRIPFSVCTEITAVGRFGPSFGNRLSSTSGNWYGTRCPRKSRIDHDGIL
jgi:hypothetical protein